MRHFTVDVFQDGNFWTWEGFATCEEHAKEIAFLQLNDDWGTSYMDWNDLAADMDGTDIRERDATEYAAERHSAEMLEALQAVSAELNLWGDDTLETMNLRWVLDKVNAVLERVDVDSAPLALTEPIPEVV